MLRFSCVVPSYSPLLSLSLSLSLSVCQVINQGFCSYKVKTPTANFCKNKYNVTGLCNRSSCPLANSRYATVLEEKGTVYLYIKTIERAHLPSKMWERIKLSSNYSQALAQITEQLQYWPNFNVHKCKQRLTKIHQYLIRMRKLKLKVRTKLVGAPKKVERREATREKKAEKAARLDDAIVKELVARLNAGTYSGSGMYLPEKAYSKVLDLVGTTEEIEEDEEEEEGEGEIEEEVEGEEGMVEGDEDGEDDEDDEEMSDTEFVADFGSDEEDDEATLEEIAAAFEGVPMDDDDGEERFGRPGDDEEEQPAAAAAASSGRGQKRGGRNTAASDEEPPSKKTKKPPPAKKPTKRVQRHVEVEYEQERESAR